MINALIDNVKNIIVNTVVLDEESQWTPPDNVYLVDITNLEVGINWTYNPQTKEWTPPLNLEPSINEIDGLTPNVID